MDLEKMDLQKMDLQKMDLQKMVYQANVFGELLGRTVARPPQSRNWETIPQSRPLALQGSKP
jgi:hypothetical protein